MKKFFLSNLIIAALVVSAVFTSCKKKGNGGNDDNDGDEPQKGTYVYVAGTERNAQNVLVAKVWINGEATELSDGTKGTVAVNVFVHGDDVYVTGYEQITNEDGGIIGRIPKFWKNGVLQNLSDEHGTPMYFNSVFVDGGNVYVAGSAGTADEYFAILWKNGVAKKLINTSNLNKNDIAYSVYETNGDVYIACWRGLWKNEEIISDIGDFCIFVENNDWYTFGGINCRKNGTVVHEINESAYTEREMYSLYVSGGNVYLTRGKTNSGGRYVATIWKNGESQELSDGSTDAYATSVYVHGDDVYVAGHDRNPATVMLWTNGIPVAITDGTRNAGAYSVFVVER